MAYRDELEALRAKLAAAEAARDAAREEARQLARALAHGGRGRPEPTRRTRDLDPAWRSIPGGEPTPVTVRNDSSRKVEVLWLSYEGKERSAGTLVPGGRIRTQTYVGHCWRIVDARTGEVLGHTHIGRGRGEPVIVFTDPPPDPAVAEPIDELAERPSR